MSQPEANNSPMPEDDDIALTRAALTDLEWIGAAADDVIENLAKTSFLRRVYAGETLFTIGQYDANEVIGIVKGEAQLTIISEESGQMMLSKLSTGSVLGLDFVLAKDEEAASRIGLVAVTDATLVYIDSAAIAETVSRKPAFARILLEAVARKLVAWSAGALGDVMPEKRVYRLLLELATCNAKGQWHIEIMPKHRELAERAGVSENEAADAVAELIRIGIVRRQYPGLVIINYDLFVSMGR
jgi:CRP/FNR family transcriptional regulator, cyclic AMP receptor protein